MIEVVYATDAFPVILEGSGIRTFVQKGSHWPTNDPVVKAYPDRFSVDPRWGLLYSQEPPGWDDPPVEQATQAPGERRNLHRSKVT